MTTYFYQYFYKLMKIDDEDINENNKLLKKKKIQFVIDCIKYSYGL